MSEIEETEPRTSLGQGASLRYFVDHAKATNEIGRFFTEVQYDGLPDSEPFEVPMHWHENHDEWIEVLEGELDITLEHKQIRLRAGDEAIFIARGRRHAVKSIPGIAVHLRERTNPTGRFKEDFFRDAFKYGAPSLMHMMRACWDGDTYIAFVSDFAGINTILNYLIGGLAKLIMPSRDTGIGSAR